MRESDRPAVILGAGPAGLTAAYKLGQSGMRSVVLEKDGCVGGLARTEAVHGCKYDIGGHRFYTKLAIVEQMWKDVLGPDLLTRQRLSRIYYRSKFFRYPIEPLDALMKLGPFEAALSAASYAKAAVFPKRPEHSIEDWLCNRFGTRLARTFFKTYTEKVWGLPWGEIGADWAAQRIRGASLAAMLKNALQPPRNSKDVIKTLINEFYYPREGPGMLWDRVCMQSVEMGAEIVMNAPVERISWRPGAVTEVKAAGKCYRGSHFVSSIPIRELIQRLDPAPPELAGAAELFKYRDFITVVLVIQAQNLFPDNWIYVHEPAIKAIRVQNYSNWSPYMVPDPSLTCLGVEYVCFEGDELWNSSEDELTRLAISEMDRLGLVDPSQVIEAGVKRMEKAYPVYDATYQEGLAAVKRFLEKVPNLQLIGRNGMHRYNNQDHSMLTAMLAVRNIFGARFNLWKVNADEDYGEEGPVVTEDEIAAWERSQPMLPTALTKAAPIDCLDRAG